MWATWGTPPFASGSEYLTSIRQMFINITYSFSLWDIPGHDTYCLS